MRPLRSRYYHKLILFAVCLITLPVAVVGGFSYYRSSDTIQEKVNGSSLQLLMLTRQQVEQILVTADNALTQLASSSTLSKALNNDVSALNRSDNVQLINDLREGMGRIKLHDSGTGEVKFVQLRYAWSLSTTFGFVKYDPEERDWRDAVRLKKGAYWTIGEQAISYVKPLPAVSLDPSAVVSLSIPYADISRYLTPRQEMGMPFVYDREFHMIHDQLPLADEQLPDLDRYAKQIEDTGLQQGLIPVRVNGESYNIIFTKSDYNGGWTYASFISVREMTKEAEAIKWFTLAVCLLVVTAGVALSLPGTRSIYVPVRRLYDQVVVAPGRGKPVEVKDEFEEIGEKVRHILLSEKRLNSELEHQRKQLNDFLMLKLFLGEARPKEIEDKLGANASQWAEMNVVVVAIDTWEGTRYGESDRNLLLFAAGNIVSDLVMPEHRLLAPIVSDQSILFLFGSAFDSREAHGQLLDSLTGSIQQMIKAYLKLQTSIGISRAFHSLSGAGRAYKEALNALDYRIKLGYESVLYMDDVSLSRRTVPEYPEMLKNELVDAIKLYDRERACGLLRQFSAEIFSNPMSNREYRMMMIVLLADLLKLLREFGELPQALFGEEKSLFDQVFELRTPDEMIQWFNERLIIPAIGLLEEMKATRHRSISSELIRMVQEEYDTDLTLEACASRLHYHPDYVRHVFRREAGMPFGEYLALHRLSVAKTWLAETSMKIAEIAERLQYTNSQNFIRYFRKMEGMTPGQYRNAQYDEYDADRR
ncbi:helix-turn-helix domain-containing protein [Cohnella hashimotonis]|uniref:Helix-turn-helix domain-containing protein n=1 Tax=Cohnella hashimotonis TaxID=2826895 RepID=A0ABT6TQ06_9BACL|nr:helix-turn-helix domain-containing protein [Cohnella hashimotonis]MDI4648809.1 helix-turn-helix domain-containing protein [Cohnella hashimotonis]